MSRKTPLALSLKQKLSSLSLSSSAQTSPTSPRASNSNPDWPSRSAFSKKRGIFNWGRRDEDEEDDEYLPTQEDVERVEAILDKVICQAGVDYE